ncbi:glycoside hydrolase family 2 TIM barrel-domain containing protein [Hymenobacter endophyticus]|uniref:Glycoside hydrolase family 2 TIM barrel-domain containing protein n=1 Tax=Hymenobacter endophyticus TaxID=3076335 RepID=A0ABU3TFS0_9BACT|nr:glycoside hydrolase family 2 TIM barrel-domain containing protein [Hymenobacter endophyticus]MDU0370232.1 glycoside hydrolase family 2 TIM barrel-domain containing protein [Hymenobacter endophyticus]
MLLLTFLSRLLCSAWVLAIVSGLLIGCQRTATPERLPPQPAGVVPVRVVQQGENARLLRGGRPYRVRGAGGLARLAEVQRAGGNSIRLWTTDYADALLDSAQQYHLTVLLGIWLGREVEGFDYYDPAAIQRQRREVEAQVLRYRHHPALLMWNLGNEMDQQASNPRVMAEINELARLIHRLDPYHPVTTTLTGQLGMLRNINAWCPDLDVLSVNAYGSLATLPADLRRLGWTRPYLVTEFGGPGWWEVPRTTWKAPVEATSTEKAAFARQCYQAGIAQDTARCLGSYVFYWGHKFELTDTWHSAFTRAGERTEITELMQELWAGPPLTNRAPRIGQLLLHSLPATASVRLKPGQRYPVRLLATDPEADPLHTRWEVTPEKPFAEENEYQQRSTPPLTLAGVVPAAARLHTTLRAPSQPGYYRLAVVVTDGQGNAATANFPFAVEP